ncbi:hypothetical protein [Pseudomonas nitroreducens]|uniref:hypothetical protein n=1 Tax=Pseudomonas nitroreducens TaxID=46680 RepID=UPI003CC82158
MNDYKSAFNAMAVDIGAIIALLGFDKYPGVDPVLRAITDLVLAKAEAQQLKGERDAALAAVSQLHSMLGVTDQVQAGERLGFLVGQSIMVPKLKAQLKRGTAYVEARQCDECQHGGINDSADGLAACHDCDWTGPDPLEDKCPGCQRENCIAAACPQCGARYVLVASEEMAAPSAPTGQVPDGWRVMRCTSSSPRDGDKWEIYDPQGSGGVVSVHDVKDWAVRGLLDALAAAPAQGGA